MARSIKRFALLIVSLYKLNLLCIQDGWKIWYHSLSFVFYKLIYICTLGCFWNILYLERSTNYTKCSKGIFHCLQVQEWNIFWSHSLYSFFQSPWTRKNWKWFRVIFVPALDRFQWYFSMIWASWTDEVLYLVHFW